MSRLCSDMTLPNYSFFPLLLLQAALDAIAPSAPVLEVQKMNCFVSPKALSCAGKNLAY